MDSSILLARIIGPLLVVVAIGLLLNRGMYIKIMKDFLESYALIYFSGALAFMIGIVMIHFHNLWVADWRVILTVIGWMSLIKGASRLIYPQFVIGYGDRLINNSAFMSISSIILLVFGLFLTAMGFQVGIGIS